MKNFVLASIALVIVAPLLLAATIAGGLFSFDGTTISTSQKLSVAGAVLSGGTGDTVAASALSAGQIQFYTSGISGNTLSVQYADGVGGTTILTGEVAGLQ